MSRFAIAVMLALGVGRAARLPLRTYTVEDGLASDYVNAIHRDSRGYLWLGTDEGLSIFNGQEFRSFNSRDGLPDSQVRAIAETSDGSMWLGTRRGLCLFSRVPGASRCTLFRPGAAEASWRINALLPAAGGTLWVGTAAGLFRGSIVSGKWSFIEFRWPDGTAPNIYSLATTKSGRLYAASDGRMMTIEPDSPAWIARTEADVRQLYVDRNDRLWGGARQLFGLLETSPAAAVARYARSWKVSTWYVHGISQDADDTFWLATGNGLVNLNTAVPGGAMRSYYKADGFPGSDFTAIHCDGEGNLWLGTTGLVRILRSGPLSYTRADGLPRNEVYILNRSRSGAIYAVAGGIDLVYSYFENARFHHLRLPLPQSAFRDAYCNESLVQTPSGDWWLATRDWLYRFPAADHPAQLESLPARAVAPLYFPLTIFAAANGDVWASSASGVADLTRWDAAARRFLRYKPGAGLPNGMPPVFAITEDKRGGIWLATETGQLFRFRQNRFESIQNSSGIQKSRISHMLRDSGGKVWGPTSHGLLCIENPEADVPRMTQLTPLAGLASDWVYYVFEDSRRNLWISTSRGVQRRDAASGAMQLFSRTEGMPATVVHSITEDREGRLWFATLNGIASLDPRRLGAPRDPPPIFFSGIRVAGLPLSLPDIGATSYPPIRLAENQANAEISYDSLDLAGGSSLRFEYRLQGLDGRWQSVDERTVVFPRLAPGEYRFEVRAVSRSAERSAQPAAVVLTVVPPIWRRWWFLLLAAVAISGSGHLLYRIRVRRLLELERVRTRIATDLHDDIGASLTRISILSELAKRKIGVNGDAATQLDSIAAQSRGLIESMNDVVWSINPRRDLGADLVQRIRDFAGGLLDPLDIEWTFQVDAAARELPIPFDVRRNLLLIFKEAIHNAARHSKCTRITLELHADAHRIEARVSDNGVGLAAAQQEKPSSGHGLASMRARAEALHGRFEAASSPGGGLTISVSVPLAARSWL